MDKGTAAALSHAVQDPEEQVVCGSHIQLGEVGNSRAFSQTLGPSQCLGVRAGVWRGMGVGELQRW